MFVVQLPLTLALCLSQNKEFLHVVKALIANYTTTYIGNGINSLLYQGI